LKEELYGDRIGGVFLDIYRFNANNGRVIEAFGSHFTLNAFGHLEETSYINMMTFESGDHVARHEAPIPQLFYVMEGSGWIAGADDIKRSIQAGEAAFWAKGEAHSAGTDHQMKAIVIESQSLNSARFMAEKV
ncbi:MAG: cupin domain-containing protein, partial [Tuberibacillus sp.]